MPLSLQVPTRTLIQIRTHAQKYFNKLGIDSGSQAAPRTSDEELVAPQSFDAPIAGALGGEPFPHAAAPRQ